MKESESKNSPKYHKDDDDDEFVRWCSLTPGRHIAG